MSRCVWLSVLIFVCGAPVSIVAQDVAIKPKPTVWLPAPSPLEAKIYGALAERTDLAFTDTPLSDAIDFLEDIHGITILLDVNSSQQKKDVGSAPVTLEVSGITLQSALNLMLKPNGLSYHVDDEVLKVVPLAEDLTVYVTRVYPIPDLAENAEDADQIVEAVNTAMTTVCSNQKTWESITYVARTHSLVIRQNRKGHAEVVELLESLRTVAASQELAKPKDARTTN